MNPFFVINPASGRKRDLATLQTAIERRCGRAEAMAAVSVCASVDELDGLIARARELGCDAVCAVGGDGTVHTVGTRLIGTSLALGIVPCGSGNGLARHLGMPMDPVSAVDAILGGRVETIDTAVAGPLPYLGIAGIGFDAEVAHRFGKAGARGLRSYVRETLLLFRTYRPGRYRVTIDGETTEHSALLIAVANSSQWGNDARIAPGASLQDGVLEVAIVEDPPLVAVPFMLRQLFAGTLKEERGLHFRRGAAVRIERPAEGPAHVDGEPVMLGREVEYAVRPASLRVVVPARARSI